MKTDHMTILQVLDHINGWTIAKALYNFSKECYICRAGSCDMIFIKEQEAKNFANRINAKDDLIKDTFKYN